MKYFLSGLAIISCLGLMLIPVNSAAQDEGQIFYSYGEVLSVMQDQILVREFDYQTGEEKDTLYYVKECIFLKWEHNMNIWNFFKV